MKYSKSLDHALLATYFANKAAKAKSLTAKRTFEKKALASILAAGKQADAAYGMRVLEASLRLAAENEGMAPVEAADPALEDLPVDDAMPIEAEAEDEEDMEVEDDADDADEADDSDDEEIDAAFRRVMARSRQRKLAARAAVRRPRRLR